MESILSAFGYGGMTHGGILAISNVIPKFMGIMFLFVGAVNLLSLLKTNIKAKDERLNEIQTRTFTIAAYLRQKVAHGSLAPKEADSYLVDWQDWLKANPQGNIQVLTYEFKASIEEEINHRFRSDENHE